MRDLKNIPLVSSEISSLWDAYMSDSLVLQVFSYFLSNVEDDETKAPRLFTYSFYPTYITFMARTGMHNYTLILNQIARTDIRDYFSKCINECIELYNKSTDLRLTRGIFIRAPEVVVPKEVKYVESESIMLDFFEKNILYSQGQIYKLSI